MGKFKTLVRNHYQQVVLVFLAFFIMVAVSYYYVSNIVRSQMQVIGEEVMNTTQTSVTGNLSETELIFANAVQALEDMVQSGDTNAEILAYLENANQYFGDARSPLPDFLKVYAEVRGEFLDGSGWVPPDDYVPASRPWHVGAVEDDGTIYFSEPYIDADTGGMCISFSKALHADTGGIVGVVAIDLNLSRITSYVAGQRIANGGYGLMLSDTLHITTHQNEALVGMAMGEVSAEYATLGGPAGQRRAHQ